MNTRSSSYRDFVIKKLQDSSFLITLDTETVGLKPDAQIIQFAAVRYRLEKKPVRLVPLSWINQYICPNQKIPDKIADLTGLTNAALECYPAEPKAFPSINEFLSMEGTVIGYNVDFDLKKIHHMYLRCNQHLHDIEYIDVLQMARDCIPREEIPNYKLETVCRYLGCNADTTFHSALEDVKATTSCFLLLLSKYLKMPVQQKKEKIIITGCDYWENPKRPSMKRIRIFSSAGRFYYDLIQKRYGANKDSDLNIEDVDLDDMEKQCLDRYHCQTIEELAGYLKRN